MDGNLWKTSGNPFGDESSEVHESVMAEKSGIVNKSEIVESVEADWGIRRDK